MNSRYDIIIVGAGAAGMMAAIAASDGKRKILLVEKMEQPGRKLRITGKGRCNLTNTAPIREFITHISPDGRFMRNAFSVFFNTELMDFFESRGVPLVVERGNRVFPKSCKSLDIFLAMIKTIEADRNIKVLKNTCVTDIATYEGRVSGVVIQNSGLVHCQCLIMATGGMSYPTTGSSGDGYALLRKVGHGIVEPVPALVPLVCAEKIPDELAGFTLKNVSLVICRQDGKKLFEMFGELTFTDNGIGGPITLSASRAVSRFLHNGERLTAKIDLKPALDEEVLDKKLISDLNSFGQKTDKRPQQQRNPCAERRHAFVAAGRNNTFCAKSNKNRALQTTKPNKRHRTQKTASVAEKPYANHYRDTQFRRGHYNSGRRSAQRSESQNFRE